MEQTIRNLTIKYLDSLKEKGKKWENGQTQKILEINSQSNWIIFHTSSISLTWVSRSHFYSIDSPQLQKLFEEQIRIYHKEDWKDTFLIDEDPDSIRIEDVKIRRIIWVGEDVDVIDYKNCWIAINKTAVGDGIGETYMEIENADLTMGKNFRKVERRLNKLLDDSEIKNSTSPQMEEENESLNGNESNPLPPENPTTDSVSFILDKVERMNRNIFKLKPKSPFKFLGEQINLVVSRYVDKIIALYNQGDLEVGKTVIITNLKLENEEAEIRNNTLRIFKYSHAEIQVFYSQIRQKNTELVEENNKLFHLATELANTIKKNNEEVSQTAQKLGLNLPTIPLDALNYFQEEFFQELDEKLPLSDPANQKKIADNETVRRKKANIQKNIDKTYRDNLKKLKHYQNPNRGPDSKLEQVRQQAIETINQVLTEKDNLRNIDLFALESGKYLNWETDLELLSSEKEIVAYRENFLTILKQAGAREKEQEKDSGKPPKNGNERVDISKIITAPSLSEARKVAERLIRELFIKYRVKLAEVEEIWVSQGSETWIEYLATIDNQEQVVQFVQNLETRAAEKAGFLTPDTSIPSSNSFDFVLPAIISVIIFVPVVAVILAIVATRKPKGGRNTNREGK